MSYYKMPQVSIIIPAYNHENYISDCLDSVIKQTATDWECLVVNDGSTDNTKEIILSYTEKNLKIRMINQPNKGLAAARNKGLSEAKGDYIQFIDSDDVIKENKLKLQLDLMLQTNEFALSITNYYYSIGNDFNIKSSRPWLSTRFRSENHLHNLISDWETKMTIPFHCFLFDANPLKILFDEQLPNHEDWDFLMNVLRLNPKIFYIDQKLAIYRVHENSMAQDKASMKNGFAQAIRKQQRFYQKNSIEYKLLSNKLTQVLHSRSLYKLGKIVKMFFPNLSLVKLKNELSNRFTNKV